MRASDLCASSGAVAGGITLAGSSAYINAFGEVVFGTDADPTLIELNALASLSYGDYLLFAGDADTDYVGLTIGEDGLITGGLSLASGYGASDLFIENGDIFVHVVPEPGTWAMLVMGLALLGGSAYYRSRRNASMVVIIK